VQASSDSSHFVADLWMSGVVPSLPCRLAAGEAAIEVSPAAPIDMVDIKCPENSSSWDSYEINLPSF
jgi:hypothetical protein